MSKVKCTGGKHVRVENPDGTWPPTCQCGKEKFGESLPALNVHVTDRATGKGKMGGS